MPPSPLQSPTTVQLGDDGILAAGTMGAQGKTEVFAQIQYERSGTDELELPIFAPDKASLQKLFSALLAQLTDDVLLIDKHSARAFTITKLSWLHDSYKIESSAAAEKPPETGIWFEPMRAPATAESAPRSTLLRRPTGQLVGRTQDLESLAEMLGALRPHIANLCKKLEETHMQGSSAQPGVHLGMTVDIHAIDRVRMKIGLNLVAHLFDVDMVRRPDFDDAVAFVLGYGSTITRVQIPARILGSKAENQHLIFLFSRPAPSGRSSLVMAMQLYGAGDFEGYILGEVDSTDIPQDPILICVNYEENRIERLTLSDYLLQKILGMSIHAP